jgi:hypothetical protein
MSNLSGFTNMCILPATVTDVDYRSEFTEKGLRYFDVHESINLFLKIDEFDDPVHWDITRIIQASPNWENLIEKQRKEIFASWKEKETSVILINNSKIENNAKKEKELKAGGNFLGLDFDFMLDIEFSEQSIFLPTFENLMRLGDNTIPYLRGDFDVKYI